MDDQCDYTFKTIIVGNAGVGKSSIVSRYCNNYYNDAYSTTIGVDYTIKVLSLDGKKIKLQLWDTAGQERFRTITSSYFRNADIVVIVFDLTNEHSFDKISDWYSELQKFITHDNYILIGNKSDHTQDIVKKSDIDKLSERLNIDYFEVSAKKNINIAEAFDHVVKISIKSKDANAKANANAKAKANMLVTTTPEPNNVDNNCCLTGVRMPYFDNSGFQFINNT